MVLRMEKLNPEQREAVEHEEGALLVLAGAGSGKTRVVTYRTALLLERGVDPRRILVVTFTNKAAGEMRERIYQMVSSEAARGLTISTFHAFGARLLREVIDRLGYRRSFTILDSADQLRVIKTSLEDLGLAGSSVRPEEIKHIISLAKRARKTPAKLEELRFSPLLPHAQRLFGVYQENLRAMSAVDFDDLLSLPLKLCSEDEEVRSSVATRYGYVMIDEYQDTNEIQLELLKVVAWRGNLVAVGDDDQSIYGFQGARASNILEFERSFPGARVVKLEQNYRCTNRILEAANALIQHNPTRHEKRLWSARGAGEKIRFVQTADEREEANWVAGEIAEECESGRVKPREVAILYRVNTQSRLFEEALRMKGVPYQVIGSNELFDRAEVRDWLAYLGVLVNPRDELSLRRIINVPRRHLGAASVGVLEGMAETRRQSMLEVLKGAKDCEELPAKARQGAVELSELVQRFKAAFSTARGAALAEVAREYFEASGLPSHMRSSEKNSHLAQRRVETIEQLIEGMGRMDREESLSDYLTRVRLDSGSQDRVDESNSGVTLLTLHSAKGLEFPAVYLVGFERGYLPHKRSEGSARAIAEERRLCYVGITRAMDRLTITAARARTRRNERIPRQVSPFLKEIPEVLLERESEEASLSNMRVQRSRDYMAQIRAMLERE